LRAQENVEAESDKNERHENVAISIYQSNHNEVITNRITATHHSAIITEKVINVIVIVVHVLLANSGVYIAILSPPFAKVIAATVSDDAAGLTPSFSAFSFFQASSFFNPIAIGTKPKRLIHLWRIRRLAKKPTRLTAMSPAIPRY
jgi:hypothetical protein